MSVLFERLEFDAIFILLTRKTLDGTTKLKNIPLSMPIQMKLVSWLCRLKKILNSMVTMEMNPKMHQKSFAMSSRKAMPILTQEICLLWTKNTLCTSLTGLVTPFGKILFFLSRLETPFDHFGKHIHPKFQILLYSGGREKTYQQLRCQMLSATYPGWRMPTCMASKFRVR